MTKNEIIDAVVDSTDLTRSQAVQAFQTIIDTISDSLVSGSDIFIWHFGTIKVVTQAPRKARDIFNNKLIDVPAKRTVRFKPSPELVKRMK